MPKRDRQSEVIDRVRRRQEALVARIKKTNPIGANRSQMSMKEFRERVNADPDFRMVMANRMGNRNLIRVMTQGLEPGVPVNPAQSVKGLT